MLSANLADPQSSITDDYGPSNGSPAGTLTMPTGAACVTAHHAAGHSALGPSGGLKFSPRPPGAQSTRFGNRVAVPSSRSRHLSLESVTKKPGKPQTPPRLWIDCGGSSRILPHGEIRIGAPTAGVEMTGSTSARFAHTLVTPLYGCETRIATCWSPRTFINAGACKSNRRLTDLVAAFGCWPSIPLRPCRPRGVRRGASSPAAASGLLLRRQRRLEARPTEALTARPEAATTRSR
jgi:hypothetical protein